MRYEAADIRVKKRLCQALTSFRARTCRKYVALFYLLIFSFFLVDSARAESVSPSQEQGKTIVVQATVALSPEFTYSIRKNSSLSSEKAAFALGEEVRVQVRIAGGGNEPCADTRYACRQRMRRRRTAHPARRTDIDGLARFSFVADADFLGSNALRATDMTYDVPIPLHQELSFLVYEPVYDQKQREQAAKNGISGDQTFSSGQIIPVVITGASGTNISPNSGTIVIIDSRTTLTRAGP
jgi:hypothetical protein